MNKLEYVTRQLARAERKRYEHYVVSRVFHLLNDLSIKFITQQYVNRPSGRALTDMYFPQFGVHIEVDEPHHNNQIQEDKLRELDIVNATGHDIIRITVSNQTIEDVNAQIDYVVNLIKSRKLNDPDFKEWNPELEHNTETYLAKGNIDLSDNCSFMTMVDGANCFGNSYKPGGIWKGGAKHQYEDKIIWFPKLYPNEKWINTISDDEETITEKSVDLDITEKYVDKMKSKDQPTRIVFARVKSPLGEVMYRFRGEYKFDTDASNYKDGLIFRRIATSVKTYRDSRNIN
jgi:very-short-patch-repair endonuclease